MIEFPQTAYIHRKLPKEAFYKHLTLTGGLKDRFVSDIDGIYVEYSLTKDNLHLEKETAVKEILIMEINLKKKDYDRKLLEVIARQNPHKLVFILSYKEEKRCAVYQGKLYQTEWEKAETVQLSARGFSLEKIWDGFVEQIALAKEESVPGNMTIEQRLERQKRIEELQQQIIRIKTLTWKEKQPKKKFELYRKMKRYIKELEDIENG